MTISHKFVYSVSDDKYYLKEVNSFLEKYESFFYLEYKKESNWFRWINHTNFGVKFYSWFAADELERGPLGFNTISVMGWCEQLQQLQSGVFDSLSNEDIEIVYESINREVND